MKDKDEEQVEWNKVYKNSSPPTDVTMKTWRPSVLVLAFDDIIMDMLL